MVFPAAECPIGVDPPISGLSLLTQNVDLGRGGVSDGCQFLFVLTLPLEMVSSLVIG